MNEGGERGYCVLQFIKRLMKADFDGRASRRAVATGEDHPDPGHNWCTAAPCTMAWFIGIAMHLHLGDPSCLAPYCTVHLCASGL